MCRPLCHQTRPSQFRASMPLCALLPLLLLTLWLAPAPALAASCNTGVRHTAESVKPDACPEFLIDGVNVDLICTKQEFDDHVFMDALVTNVSGGPISSYQMVVALYDADGHLLASSRVQRSAREGMLDSGCSQDERFVVVNVKPADVAKVVVMPVPR